MTKTLLLVALMSMAAGAQTTAPADRIHDYDFVIGHWECKGLTPQGKVDYTFHQDVEKPANSRWFWFRDPSHGSSISFLTYEPKAHLWRYISISDSSYAMGTAPDFVNDRHSWTGATYYNDGRTEPWDRIEFIKINDREKREDFYEVKLGQKERFVAREECTKTK